jgi:hypothetical protein
MEDDVTHHARGSRGGSWCQKKDWSTHDLLRSRSGWRFDTSDQGFRIIIVVTPPSVLQQDTFLWENLRMRRTPLQQGMFLSEVPM